MRLLITGANGLVGGHYIKMSDLKSDFLTPNENDLDITDVNSVANYFSTHKPDAVINFAAFTDVKKCEEQRNDRGGTAWKVNVGGVKNLLHECARFKTHFIQISTDLIFSGKDNPAEAYPENSPYSTNLNKISWYGITKMEAEKILSEHKHATIVRIAYPFTGGSGPKLDLLHNIIDLYDKNALYPMFTDNSVTPTYIEDLSRVLDAIVIKLTTGVFHAVSSDPLSHYDFAKLVLEQSGRDPEKLAAASLKEFSAKSGIPRPQFINLDTTLTSQTLGVTFGTIKDNIIKALNTLSFK